MGARAALGRRAPGAAADHGGDDLGPRGPQAPHRARGSGRRRAVDLAGAADHVRCGGDEQLGALLRGGARVRPGDLRRRPSALLRRRSPQCGGLPALRPAPPALHARRAQRLRPSPRPVVPDHGRRRGPRRDFHEPRLGAGPVVLRLRRGRANGRHGAPGGRGAAPRGRAGRRRTAERTVSPGSRVGPRVGRGARRSSPGVLTGLGGRRRRGRGDHLGAGPDRRDGAGSPAGLAVSELGRAPARPSEGLARPARRRAPAVALGGGRGGPSAHGRGQRHRPGGGTTRGSPARTVDTPGRSRAPGVPAGLPALPSLGRGRPRVPVIAHSPGAPHRLRARRGSGPPGRPGPARVLGPERRGDRRPGPGGVGRPSDPSPGARGRAGTGRLPLAAPGPVPPAGEARGAGEPVHAAAGERLAPGRGRRQRGRDPRRGLAAHPRSPERLPGGAAGQTHLCRTAGPCPHPLAHAGGPHPRRRAPPCERGRAAAAH